MHIKWQLRNVFRFDDTSTFETVIHVLSSPLCLYWVYTRVYQFMRMVVPMFTCENPGLALTYFRLANNATITTCYWLTVTRLISSCYSITETLLSSVKMATPACYQVVFLYWRLLDVDGDLMGFSAMPGQQSHLHDCIVVALHGLIMQWNDLMTPNIWYIAFQHGCFYLWHILPDMCHSQNQVYATFYDHISIICLKSCIGGVISANMFNPLFIVRYIRLNSV